MILHDFPWGEGKRAGTWDTKLSSSDFKRRIAAVNRLNTYPNSVSFALCSPWDQNRIRSAYVASGWEGGSIRILIEKLGKWEPTKHNYGLINVCQDAVVTFKGKQSEATWCFMSQEVEHRKTVWQVVPEKKKEVDEEGKIINPSQQPLGIDQKALTHWSRIGEWIFVDGFGSGTSIIAALRTGRHAVGTEPDARQFHAAVRRLQHWIAQGERETKLSLAKQKAEELLENRSKKTSREAQALALRLKKKKEKKVLLSPDGSQGKVSLLYILYLAIGK